MLSELVLSGGSHADRPVALERDADGATVVVKRYSRDGADAIFESMGALWASPFGAERRCPGMPQPLSLRAEERAIVMSYLPGTALGFRGGLGPRATNLDEAARLLADLHGSGVGVPRVRSNRGLVRSVVRKRDELAPSLLRDLFDEAISIVAEATPPGADEMLVVNHGDFSPRNVIVTAEGLQLIDFDRLQMAAPGRDVEYFAAWIWVTDLMSGHGEGWALGEAFASAYCRSATDAAAQIEAGRPFFRAMALLRIAHGWSALRRQPDVAEVVAREAIRQLG